MSIYKQIIFLAILLFVVMFTCVFIHINDFEEVNEVNIKNEVIKISEIEEKKTEPIVVEKQETKEKIEVIKETKKEIIPPKKEILESVEKKIEKKVEPKISKKQESIDSEKIVIDVQKELDKILSKEKIFFKRLSTDITKKSFKTVNKIAKVLKDNKDVKIEIGGHTDAKGKDDVNKWVSLQRAISVKKELIKLGISKNRIKAKGYGETKPLVPNDKNGYSIENRRVEFKIIEE